MNSILSIGLIVSLVLQVISPFSTSTISSPKQDGLASSALAQLTDSAPILGEQLKLANDKVEKTERVNLKLKATPQLVIPGETVLIEWSVTSWNKVKDSAALTLEVDLPEGIATTEKLETKATDYGTTAMLPVSLAAGILPITIAKDAKLPIVVDVKLRSNGK